MTPCAANPLFPRLLKHINNANFLVISETPYTLLFPFTEPSGVRASSTYAFRSQAELLSEVSIRPAAFSLANATTVWS